MRDARLKGILLGALGILFVSVMMGVAHASAGNDNTDDGQYPASLAGADLKLRDQDEPWQDGVVATWTAANMAPGDEFAFDGSFVGLQSDGRGKIDITCLYQVFEESPQAQADTDPQTDLHPDRMAKQMAIYRFTYFDKKRQIDLLTGEQTRTADGSNPTPAISTSDDWRVHDVDGDGSITFYDLKQSPLTNLPSPRRGETHLEMSVRFDQGAGNEFQGDTFDLTVVFSIAPATPPCSECEGGVISLTLQYNGVNAADIMVKTKKDDVVLFHGNVPAGGQFTFIGAGKDDKMGPEIIILVDGAVNASIHTSCSQPIGPGLVAGDFEVVAGVSLKGGELYLGPR